MIIAETTAGVKYGNQLFLLFSGSIELSRAAYLFTHYTEAFSDKIMPEQNRIIVRSLAVYTELPDGFA